MQTSFVIPESRRLGAVSTTSGLRRTVPRGGTLYLEEDPAADWFVVVSGVVRTCRHFANGTRQVTGFYFTDGALGLDPAYRRSTAQAVTDAVVIRYDHALLDSAIVPVVPTHASPHDVLMGALGDAEERVALLGYRRANGRVAGFLLSLTPLEDSDGFVHLPMGRADIADFLSLTVETVSRTLTAFVNDDVIEFHGPHHVRVLNVANLRGLISGKSMSSARAPRTRRQAFTRSL
jgi:CRP/FNR family transcriptional regulator